MWAAYSRALKAAPVRTNLFTATVVTGAGDALAQTLAATWHAQAAAGDDSLDSARLTAPPPPPVVIDLQRVATVTAYWGATAPVLFGWFRWLDVKFPTGAPSGARSPVPTAKGLATLAKKLLVHQWAFVPVLNGVFFAYLVLVDHTLRQQRGADAGSSAAADPHIIIMAHMAAQQRQDGITLSRIKRQQNNTVLQRRLWEEVPPRLWEAQKTSVVVWGMAHTFNFLFLPPHTRVLFNSGVGVFWSAYLSIVGHQRAG
jgi:hypothetical protein